MALPGRFVLIIILSIFLVSGIYAEKTLFVVVSNNAPLAFRNENYEISGFCVDILRDIARHEDWTLKFIYEHSFRNTLQHLEETPDMIHSALAFSMERSEKYDFTNETVFNNWSLVFTRKGMKIESILDLENKTVALVSQGIHSTEFRKLIRGLGVNCRILPVSNNADAAEIVKRKKADAMVTSRTWGKLYAHEYSLVETSIIFNPIEIRFASLKGQNSEILSTIDKYLKEMKENKASLYYSKLNSVFSEDSLTVVPAWIRYLLIISLIVILSSIIVTYLMRREIKKQTRNLSESRETFKNLVKFTKAIHWNYDLLHDKFSYVSPQAAELIGYPPEEWTNLASWAEMIHADEREWAVNYCKTETGNNRDHSFVYRIITRNGETKWIQDIVKVISIQEKPQKLIGVMLDITDGKIKETNLQTALREKEILLKEIHHRVKNNLSIVTSLLALQARQIKDKESIVMLNQSIARIRSMAIVHEQLYEVDNITGININTYLRALVGSVRETYETGKKISIIVDADNLIFDIELMVPLGLIVNEILTNAFKYAFYNNPKPELQVSLKYIKSNQAVLTIKDNGCGIDPSTKTKGGVGMMLVENLTMQINGKLEIKSDGGTCVTVRLPVNPDQIIQEE